MIHLSSVYNPLFLDKDKQIILVTGGRGSGKSFAVGTFIERLSFEYNEDLQLAHNILFARYTMTSAEISVIPEMIEKIDMDGTERYFRKTSKDVVNKMTKARIMFRGIHTSSGNQTAKLKSIKGITTFVCDEAEEWTSYQDFEKILLSIRQKGLQNRIIIIMNPADSNHFVYEHFIKDTHKLVEYDGVPVQISTHPNVLHIHTSYLDNIDNLDEKFLENARRMKETDPDRYAHVFMGRWDDVAEGAVFKKWGIVDEFPDGCKHEGLGMDFGYFPDPTAIVRCGVIGNRMYLDEVSYENDLHAPQAAERLNQYPDLITFAECADERFAKDIAHHGPILRRVAKGPGSIMAGLNKMMEYELFITKRSVNLQHELRNYVWAKDVFGKYINLPEDHDNHCFVADTLIVLNGNLKRIIDVREGDEVLTSHGYRKVERFFDNGFKKTILVRIGIDKGFIEIEGTPDHKIKTTKGWKQLSKLTKGDELYMYKPSTENNITYTRERNISHEDARGCTARCGLLTMGQFLRGIMSTIKMRIRGIMTFLTSRFLKDESTCACTCTKGCKTRSLSKNSRIGWDMQESMQTDGMAQKMDGSGILSLPNSWRQTEKRRCLPVNGVGQNTKPMQMAPIGSAPTNARRPQDTIVGLMMKSEPVNVVERNSHTTNTRKKSSVQDNAHMTIVKESKIESVEIVKRGFEHVYDLQIAKEHEFIANGILVHNCIDAARYWVNGDILGHILTPRATTKEELGIF